MCIRDRGRGLGRGFGVGHNAISSPDANTHKLKLDRSAAASPLPPFGHPAPRPGLIASRSGAHRRRKQCFQSAPLRPASGRGSSEDWCAAAFPLPPFGHPAPRPGLIASRSGAHRRRKQRFQSAPLRPINGRGTAEGRYAAAFNPPRRGRCGTCASSRRLPATHPGARSSARRGTRAPGAAS